MRFSDSDEVKRIEEESKVEESSSELQEDSVVSGLSEDQKEVYNAAMEGYVLTSAFGYE